MVATRSGIIPEKALTPEEEARKRSKIIEMVNRELRNDDLERLRAEAEKPQPTSFTVIHDDTVRSTHPVYLNNVAIYPKIKVPRKPLTDVPVIYGQNVSQPIGQGGLEVPPRENMSQEEHQRWLDGLETSEGPIRPTTARVETLLSTQQDIKQYLKQLAESEKKEE